MVLGGGIRGLSLQKNAKKCHFEAVPVFWIYWSKTGLWGLFDSLLLVWSVVYESGLRVRLILFGGGGKTTPIG